MTFDGEEKEKEESFDFWESLEDFEEKGFFKDGVVSFFLDPWPIFFRRRCCIHSSNSFSAYNHLQHYSSSRRRHRPFAAAAAFFFFFELSSSDSLIRFDLS